MARLKYTLIADGSSDSALLHVISWLLNDLYPTLAIDPSFADFTNLPKPPKTLEEKITEAKKRYPYDILFIHRDAESNDNKLIDERIAEIKKAIGDEKFERTVCIVPVRMMEAWLLINQEAIKKAAGNRNFAAPINLPNIKKLDQETDPKSTLYNLLKTTSGKKGRQLAKFNEHYAVHLVAEYTENYSALRGVQAFDAFEMALKEKVDVFIKRNP